MRAVVFDPRGEFRGFHVLSLPLDLAPGETTYALYRAPGVAVAPTDRLVLLPHLARGRGLAWQLEAAEVERTLAALAEARGEVETPSRVTAQDADPPVGGIENPINECKSACSAEGTACEGRCKCGVSNFSCTCSAEQISHSCSCFQCPPSPG